jgi:hypothetical protein
MYIEAAGTAAYGMVIYWDACIRHCSLIGISMVWQIEAAVTATCESLVH